MLNAEHAAGLLRGSVGTAHEPAVLASEVCYVTSSQIMGELSFQAVEVSLSQGTK
jgi:hypothetical protein